MSERFHLSPTVDRLGGEDRMAEPYIAIHRVEFLKPVLVGDVVRFITRLVRLGRTSITMHVQVEAERGRDVIQVTSAEVVYVGVDLNTPERKPKPLLDEQPAS